MQKTECSISPDINQRIGKLEIYVLVVRPPLPLLIPCLALASGLELVQCWRERLAGRQPLANWLDKYARLLRAWEKSLTKVRGLAKVKIVRAWPFSAGWEFVSMTTNIPVRYWFRRMVVGLHVVVLSILVLPCNVMGLHTWEGLISIISHILCLFLSLGNCSWSPTWASEMIIKWYIYQVLPSMRIDYAWVIWISSSSLSSRTDSISFIGCIVLCAFSRCTPSKKYRIMIAVIELSLLG